VQPGRKPKPLLINKLNGFPGKAKYNSKAKKLAALDLMVPALGAVFIPDHLHEDAQACVQVIKDSMPVGLYSRADSYALAAFACAWAVHKRAAHELANPEFDWVVTYAGKSGPNAWIKIMFEAGRQMATMGDRLGLSPSSRASLQMPSKYKQPQEDPFSNLLELNASSSS